MSNEWQEKKSPASLQRRYEFSDYSSLSRFLEQAAEISKNDDLYPDIGFGRTYANVTIYAADGSDELGEKERNFSVSLDKLFADSVT